jgi:hypothetical protein
VQAFNAFKQSLVDRSGRHSLLKQALAKIAKATLSRAFATWRCLLVQREHRQTSAELIAKRWRCLELSIAFTTWADLASHAVAQRERLVQKFAPAIRRAIVFTTRAAFTEWRDVVRNGGIAAREQRLLKSCVQRIRERLRSEAFYAWVSNSAAARDLRCRLASILCRVAYRSMALAFYQWCGLSTFDHMLHMS